MKPEFRATHVPMNVKGRGAIRVVRRYRAPPERVFHAWLDPDLARGWLFATAWRPMARAEVDARVAGWFRFVDKRCDGLVEHRGEYLAIVPHRRLAFTLTTTDRPHVVTRVDVEIASRANGCEVVLNHHEVPRRDASNTRERWIGILYGLGATLEA